MAKISHYDSDGDDDATLNGLSDSDTEEPASASAGVSEPPAPPSSQPPPNPQESAGLKAAKNVGIGLACLVGIPVGAALLTAGGVLYGAGKILEGVGRGLAVGPEAVANAMNVEQVKQQPAEAPKSEEKQNSPPQPRHKPKRKRKPRKPKPKSND